VATWRDVVVAAPELAGSVQARFRAHQHHTLATLRRDGSPRISGTEVMFAEGAVWLGSMGGSRKAQDLRRDPRYALHSHSEDVDDDAPGRWPGDAKLAGRAAEEADLVIRTAVLGDHDEPGSHLFRLDVDEVVTTVVAPSGDHLVITLWTPARGVVAFRRA
jgi:hypothetical protein